MRDMLHFLIYESLTTRKIIYILSGTWVLLWFLEKLLERKRSLAPLVISLVIKALCFFVVDYYLLLHPGIDPTSDTVLRMGIFSMNLLSTVLCFWVYGGNYGKTGIAAVIGEMIIAIYSIPALVFVNLIEKRPAVGELIGTFHPADLLLPVAVTAVWWITKKPAESLAARYRRWVPKHQWLLWVSFFLFTYFSNIIGAGSEFASGKFNLYANVYQFTGMFMMGMLMIWLWYQQHREDQRRIEVEEQLAILKKHETVLQKNTEMAGRIREDIRLQTEQLERQIERMDPEETGQVQAFLKQLKTDMQGMKADAGISGDPMIDSILSKWEKQIEGRGGRVDYQCGGLRSRQGVDSSLLAQMLELLCEEWYDEHFSDRAGDEQTASELSESVLRVKMIEKREQLLLSANLSGSWKRRRWKQFKDRLNSAGGSVVGGRKGEEVYLIPIR